MKSAIAVLALASLATVSSFAAPQTGQGTTTPDTATNKHGKKHSSKSKKHSKTTDNTTTPTK